MVTPMSEINAPTTGMDGIVVDQESILTGMTTEWMGGAGPDVIKTQSTFPNGFTHLSRSL